MLRITILHLCLEIWAKSEKISEIKPPLAFQMCMLDKKYPPQFAENIFNRQFSSYQCVFPSTKTSLPASRLKKFVKASILEIETSSIANFGGITFILQFDLHETDLLLRY